MLVKRTLFDKVVRHLDSPEITVINGPRQVGKTVLLKQLQTHLIQEKHINPRAVFYFNLDILKDKEIFQNQTNFIEFIKQKSVSQKTYFFIDEAQKVENAGVFFKGVYDSDLNAKIILTGSSSLDIRAKIHESLTGRKRVFNLLPFSFSEILKSQRSDLDDLIQLGSKIHDYDQREIINIFTKYCVQGGYPRAILEPDELEKKEILNEIFTSYVEKDIIGFLKIENESNFNKLVGLLAGQIGNLINVAELSSLVGTDRYTIDRYLLNLEKTFIIHNLKPFFTNKRQEVVKASKLYFMDNGLRNSALNLFDQSFGTRMDRGALLENAIFKELLVLQALDNFNLRFWRSKQKSELDFIVEKGVDILPIEVKANVRSDKLETSFLGFLTRYHPKQALVVNLSYQTVRQVGETQVRFIYPYELGRYI